MSGSVAKRLVREGELVAEVKVELEEADGGWTPYLSLEDTTNSTMSETRCARATSPVRRSWPTVSIVLHRLKSEAARRADRTRVLSEPLAHRGRRDRQDI